MGSLNNRATLKDPPLQFLCFRFQAPRLKPETQKLKRRILPCLMKSMTTEVTMLRRAALNPPAAVAPQWRFGAPRRRKVGATSDYNFDVAQTFLSAGLRDILVP